MTMSKEQEELVEKVKALMQKKYGADDATALRKLFDHYDANKDGKIEKRELETMLADAGIGNSFTRGMWVKGVMGELDTNEDKLIDWSELSKALG
jgi:Ca2+-binding EF-hand superfamily protein